MSHGLKLLLIAAGAIITCIVVVVGFGLTKSGKSDTSKAAEQYTGVMGSYDDVALTVYEDSDVSGADVVSYIKENASAIVNNQITQILVTTKAPGAQSYAATAYAKKTAADVKSDLAGYQKVTTEANYINPSGTFACTVERNKNGMITTINFAQE